MEIESQVVEFSTSARAEDVGEPTSFDGSRGFASATTQAVTVNVQNNATYCQANLQQNNSLQVEQVMQVAEARHKIAMHHAQQTLEHVL